MRATDRLEGEGRVSLQDLDGELFHANGVTVRLSVPLLMRWGRKGKAGVVLDVMLDYRRGAFVTSRAALERFAAGLAAKVSLERVGSQAG